VATIDELVFKAKASLIDAFSVIHRILTRLPFLEDMIFYSKVTIRFCQLLEESGDFRTAVQSLRSAVGKVVEYREERLKKTPDFKACPATSLCLTVDNKKILDLENKMDIVFSTWEGLILRKERDRERREKEEGELEEDEGDEEQHEVAKCIEELKEKDLFERNIDLTEWRRNSKKQPQTYSE